MNQLDITNLNWIAALGVVLILTLFLCSSEAGTAASIEGAKVVSEIEGQEEDVLVVSINEDYKEKISRLMKEASFFYKKKHYRGALQRAEQVLKMDKENKDARSLQILSKSQIKTTEEKMLIEADRYYRIADYVAAVQLYNKYLDERPYAHPELKSKIINCYHNLGVRSLKDWECHTAADYFRQVLFLGGRHILSIDGLKLATECNRFDIEHRKAVALMSYLR